MRRTLTVLVEVEEVVVEVEESKAGGGDLTRFELTQPITPKTHQKSERIHGTGQNQPRSTPDWGEMGQQIGD